MHDILDPRPHSAASGKAFFPVAALPALFICFCLGSLGLTAGSAAAQSGWTPAPSPTGMNLYSVDFPDADLGWISGEEGTILHTTDGGAAWETQSTDVIYDLRGISFGSPSVGIAVGGGGTIVRTTDGGATWITVVTGYVDSFFNVEMQDDHFACAVGTTGIHHAWAAMTNDGGASWMYRDFFINGNYPGTLTAVHFTGPLTGFATAYVQGGTGAICRTTDQGNSWSTLLTTPYGLYSISFPTPLVGYACGMGGQVLRTTDGGATWVTGSTGSGQTEYGVSFPDAAEGWAVGGAGHILRTTDAGASWGPQESGTALQLNAVAMTDDLHGITVGDDGLILRTATGGESGAGVPGLVSGTALRILSNRPNPFTRSTEIRFTLPEPGAVGILIFDLLGREVRAARLEEPSSGAWGWTWDGKDDGGRDLPRGSYLCRLSDARGTVAERLLIRTSR